MKKLLLAAAALLVTVTAVSCYKDAYGRRKCI
jgi:hypothetical protein